MKTRKKIIDEVLDLINDHVPDNIYTDVEDSLTSSISEIESKFNDIEDLLNELDIANLDVIGKAYDMVKDAGSKLY